MKQRLQEVRIEDFDIAALRRAAREGRLYIVPAVECETNIEQEVLRYVASIAPYAVPEYRECIDEVWRRIVNHPDLAPLLVSRKEAFNKYVVTVIAIYLKNRGVYAFDTEVAVHQALEELGACDRNKYYTGRTMYALTMRGCRTISTLISMFAQENLDKKCV